MRLNYWWRHHLLEVIAGVMLALIFLMTTFFAVTKLQYGKVANIWNVSRLANYSVGDILPDCQPPMQIAVANDTGVWFFGSPIRYRPDDNIVCLDRLGSSHIYRVFAIHHERIGQPFEEFGIIWRPIITGDFVALEILK